MGEEERRNCSEITPPSALKQTYQYVCVCVHYLSVTIGSRSRIIKALLFLTCMLSVHILYSRKYWRELNLAVEPKIAIARILADLNLAVRYGIAIRIYASRKL